MEIIIGPEFPKKIIPLINNAKNTIHIVVFDWRWYPSDPANPVSLFNQALVRAVRNGVRVSAIVNFPSIVKTLNDLGVNAKSLTTKSLVHAKLLLIDDNIVVLGSHNYTQNAFVSNHEISVIFEDKSLSADLLKYFQDLWQL